VIDRHEIERALARFGVCEFATPKVGFVYAVRCATTGLTKLGQTDDLEARLRALQNGCPTELHVVSVAHDASLERVLHAAYRTVRRHGEWFDIGHEDPLPVMRARCLACWLSEQPRTRRQTPDLLIAARSHADATAHDPRRPPSFQWRGKERSW
jgi:hypothetical protein